MDRKRILAVVFFTGLFSLVLGSGQAMAQETANVNVSATVLNGCSITAEALDFGTFDPVAAADVNGEADVRLRCTRGTAWALTLDAGLYLSGTLRRMRNSSDTDEYLSYSLYSDSAHTTAWPAAGVSGTAANSGTFQITLFGLVGGAQDVAAGSYSDVVIATVNF